VFNNVANASHCCLTRAVPVLLNKAIFLTSACSVYVCHVSSLTHLTDFYQIRHRNAAAGGCVPCAVVRLVWRYARKTRTRFVNEILFVSELVTKTEMVRSMYRGENVHVRRCVAGME
jgi:hypothetical protein